MRRLAIALLALLSACATAPSHPPVTSIPPPASHPPPDAPAPPSATHLSWDYLQRLNWPAPQTRFHAYPNPVSGELWTIYSSGGVELYCRYHFSATEASAHAIVYESRRILITWEHAFPADSIAAALGFTDRDCTIQARANANQALCEAAISDMFNLWPAFGPINSSRGNHAFAELAGDGTTSDNFPYCPDFERTYRRQPVYIEPDDAARGDIARALIYMHFVYGLPLNAVIDQPDRLLRWAEADPVDGEELRRERAIRGVQPGSWNPLVSPAGPQS